MIERLSEYILKFISDNTDIDDNISEVYQYGIEITVSSILNILLVIFFGLITGDVIRSAVFLASFIPIRSYSGGYHANTYLRCNLIFVLTFLLVVLLSRISEALIGFNLIVYIILFAVSFLPIIIFAPVKNANKKLSVAMIKKSRILSVVLFLFSVLISMFLIFFKINYGIVMVMTVAAVSVMIIIEIFMQRRGYREV